MQKKLIALAIAGLTSSAAFAQANVTVYGKIDMSYEHSSGTNGSKTSGINAGGHDGSRIGFKGEETLGSGMKAIFGLEYGSLRVDRQSGITGSRETYLGLNGNFGTVKAGRIYSTGDNFGGKYDSMDAANSYSPLQYFAAYSGSTITTGATSNSIGWESNSMSGFTVRTVYGFAPDISTGGVGRDNVAYGTTAATKDQERLFGIGLDFDRGPLSVGFVHHRLNDVGNAQNADQRESAIAASYNFGPAALYGTYQRTTADNGGAGAKTPKFNIGSVGVTVPVGTPGLVRLMYARFDTKYNNPATPRNENTDDAKSWGALYEHSMSKRTKAYVGYNHMKNSGQQTFVTPAGDGNGGQSSVAQPVLGGGKSSGYGFGVIHAF